MSQIIDISRTLTPGIPVWPGDTEYKPFRVMSIDDGYSCNVGSVTMSLHTGTHADAPSHFINNAPSIAEVDLSAYIGPAWVVDMTGVAQIDAEQVTKLTAGKPERILFKTESVSEDSFPTDCAYITPDGAEALVKLGVKLIGLDTPSVDQVDSKTLDTHKILANGSIAILENLRLSHVTPGEYELIALPLNLAGMDASPVRAVLRAIPK